MQTLTSMDMVVIKDSYYVTTVNENVYRMKLTHLLSTFFLKTSSALLYASTSQSLPLTAPWIIDLPLKLDYGQLSLSLEIITFAFVM